MNKIESIHADNDWKHARRQLLYKEVVCLVKGCSIDLLSFEDARKQLHLKQRFDRGLQEIPLDNIRGSVGRYDDFSSAFLPRKDHMIERWENVDVAMREGKTPPIEVYQVGQSYFVLDGNHRVSVARQLGRDTIDAYVNEYPMLSWPKSEADIDEALIQIEQSAFLEKAGPENSKAAGAMDFSCPGCYKDLSNQIEIYRRGKQDEDHQPLTFEAAFSAWNEEVYEPSIKAIRKHDLLSLFPNRTEGDLFLWSCENSEILEGIADEDATD
jgi:uncharacterized ParB-like nuclease family protein